MALLRAFWGSSSTLPNQGRVNPPFEATAAETNPQFQLDLASARRATTATKQDKMPSRRRFMAVPLHPAPVVRQRYRSHRTRLCVK